MRKKSEWRAIKAKARYRVRRKVRLTECERCGAGATERHHRDGNPLNCNVGNIMQVCHSCHVIEDERIGKPWWSAKPVLA